MCGGGGSSWTCLLRGASLDYGGGGWSFLEINIFVGKMGKINNHATRHGGNTAYPEKKK